MQQGDSNSGQLLDMNDHRVDAAAVDSTSEAAAADSDAQAVSADDSSSSAESVHLLGLKEDVKQIAHKAPDGVTDLKNSMSNKFHGFESSHVDSDTAAVAGAHVAAVTSSRAVGGKSPPPSASFSSPSSFLL